MREELKPCSFCGQQQGERQMLVVERCDSDGYYIKCDSCGACGPVGYPGEEYDACDGSACDKANQDAESRAITVWNELWEEREHLRAELSTANTRISELEKERDWHSVDDADNLARCLYFLGCTPERYQIHGQHWPTSTFQRAVRHVLAGIPDAVGRINAGLTRKDEEIALLQRTRKTR